MTGSAASNDSRRESRRDPAREQRGFALYVGLSEATARQSGVEIGEVVDALKRALVARVPTAESHALAVVAPVGMDARDLELVLRATIERPPSDAASTPPPERVLRRGVVFDLARHRVLVDESDVGLTFKEFALLHALIRNDGRTLSRSQLRDEISVGDDSEINDRTIDVHVRRLRAKFRDYPDVIRTVHSKGYRFGARTDVTVLRSSTPSPDLI